MTGCDGKDMVLYLCMDRSVVRYEDTFCIKDLGSMTCSDMAILAHVKAHKIYHFRHPGNMVISVTKVIEEIHRIYPALEVVNLGETDVIMEYRSGKPRQAEQMAKTVLLCVLLFIGAGFAIMAFHNDISITEVFERFYLQVMGREKPQVSVIEISYSIGLAVGILFFYNLGYFQFGFEVVS